MASLNTLFTLFLVLAIVTVSNGHAVDVHAAHAEHQLQQLEHYLHGYLSQFSNSSSAYRYLHKCLVAAVDACKDTESGQAMVHTPRAPDVDDAQVYFAAAMYYMEDCYATLKEKEDTNDSDEVQAFEYIEDHVQVILFSLQSALNAVPDVHNHCVYV